MDDDVRPRTIRLRRILELHGDALRSAAIRDRRGPRDAEVVIDALAGADPHPRKAFTQWLAVTYARGGFLFEDLGKAQETLKLFMDNRASLPAAERDIGRHRTLASLWGAVACFAAAPAVSGREEDRRERDAAREESRILLERKDGLIVAVPLTERAAKWWGRGTRWCTSADKDNAFDDYNSDGPMVVIILPDGRKMQVSASPMGGECQFMDAGDEKVDLVNYDQEDVETLRPILMAMAALNLEILLEIPRSAWDREFVTSMVTRHPEALGFIEEDRRDIDLCMLAVHASGDALRYMPPAIVDRDLCLVASASGRTPLEWVPEEMRDAALCLAFVIGSGLNLPFVPMALRSKQMCRTAMASGHSGSVVMAVPPQHRDRDIWRMAIGTCPWMLSSMPEEMRTRDLCEIAVTTQGSTLWMVPERMRDVDLCATAVRMEPQIWRAVPDHLVEAVVERSGVNASPVANREWSLAILDSLERDLKALHAMLPCDTPTDETRAA